MDALNSFYTGVNERVGVILKSGEIRELVNICPEPTQGFTVDSSVLVELEEQIEATWHTHPGATSNLSTDDHIAFLAYPDWKHFIVGSDGVQGYIVRNDQVVRDGA